MSRNVFVRTLHFAKPKAFDVKKCFCSHAAFYKADRLLIPGNDFVRVLHFTKPTGFLVIKSKGLTASTT